jgi:hypothetical protein
MSHRTGTVYDPAGSHAVAIARSFAPGEGLTLRLKVRWCFRCQQDKSPQGGKYRGPMFVCAACCSARGGKP